MKILYVTTVAITMNFFPEHIQMLQRLGHQVELASNLSEPWSERVERLGCVCHHIPFSRSPFGKGNLKAYRELKRLLAENRYDIVHTHTPNASAMVRLACRKLRGTGLRVFYTAHGFHFYTGAPLKNWLIYYPVEWLLSRWTDVLITINHEDYRRAKEKFHAGRTEYVPGVGVDVDGFAPEDYAPGERRAELGIPGDAVLLLSVGELNENKNHGAVIRAIAQLNMPSIYYVICGAGQKEAELKALAAQLGVAARLRLPGVRPDIPQWMAEADIFVIPSFREGLNVSLIEAMASGLPAICSDIRGNRDLIERDRGGLLCSPRSSDGFAQAIKALSEQRSRRAEMGAYNKNKAHGYATETVIQKLKRIYGSEDGG